MAIPPTFALLPSPANGTMQKTWSFDMTTEQPSNCATCDRIFDFLYLGGYLAAENVEWLRHMNITCVINVRKVPLENLVDGIEYVNIDVDDDEYEPIHWYFDETAEKIEKHRAANGRVLVNCEMGISRSATICIAYLVRFQNRPLRQAYYQVKNLRSCIRPNLYFWKPMINYEKKYRDGKYSVKLIDSMWSRAIPDVYM